MYNSNIIFVAGTICSGKSWFASKLADDLNYDFVEVSRIVGGILSSNMRNDLQGHPELHYQIIEDLKDIRKSTKKDGLVISGPRQVELLQAFPEAETIWMDTPIEVFLHRVYERDADKDGKPTLEAFNHLVDKDEELGLKEVEKYITLNNFKKNKI